MYMAGAAVSIWGGGGGAEGSGGKKDNNIHTHTRVYTHMGCIGNILKLRTR